MTSTECRCLALASRELLLSLVTTALFAEPDPCFVIPELNLRNEAQDMVSWTIPACQMNAAKTDRILSATDGLMASTTGPIYSGVGGGGLVI